MSSTEAKHSALPGISVDPGVGDLVGKIQANGIRTIMANPGVPEDRTDDGLGFVAGSVRGDLDLARSVVLSEGYTIAESGPLDIPRDIGWIIWFFPKE